MQKTAGIIPGDLVYCNSPKMSCMLQVVAYPWESSTPAVMLRTVDSEGTAEAKNVLACWARCGNRIQFIVPVTSIVAVNNVADVEYIELHLPNKEVS